jgi:DNA polymerase-1
MKTYRRESLDYEGDDYLASCAALADDSFDEIRIITGDKDLLQLVNDQINVCLTRKGVGELEEFTIDNFYEKMSITPDQIPDFKGLVGDASDNLPGIRGIGEVTAKKLLAKYPTLESIIEHADEIGGKTAQLIKDGKEIGLHCKRLATLKRDITLDFRLEDCKVQDYDTDELISFFKEVEFYSLLKKLNKKKITFENLDMKIISDPKAELQDILNTDGVVIAEVFGSYLSGEFLGMSFVSHTHQIFFTKDAVIKNPAVRRYLESPEYAKKTFDCKALILAMMNIGIRPVNVKTDLMIAAYLINPAYGSEDFKKTVDNFCTNDIAYDENIYGSNTKMAIPALEVYAKYSIDKCLIIRKLEETMISRLEKDELMPLYDIEMKLALVLAKMESEGLLIDLNRLDEIGREFQKKADAIAEDIYFIAGEEFNINSPKKLGDILFEKLHLPHGKKN